MARFGRHSISVSCRWRPERAGGSPTSRLRAVDRVVTLRRSRGATPRCARTLPHDTRMVAAPRFDARLEGRFMRCLEPREAQDAPRDRRGRPGRRRGGPASPYVDGAELNLRAWANRRAGPSISRLADPLPRGLCGTLPGVRREPQRRPARSRRRRSIRAGRSFRAGSCRERNQRMPSFETVRVASDPATPVILDAEATVRQGRSTC